jgi:lysozyme family protein
MAYPELFNRCIEVVLKNEGGDKIVNHPNDPGGLTRWGITQRNYPELNIKALTKAKAISIYYADYWMPMNLAILNDEDLILHVYDMGVNAGIRTAIRLLQRLVEVKDDGYIGYGTARGVSKFEGDVVAEYIKRRKLYYITLVQRKESLRPFIKGWLNRIEHTKF